jgi:hypothetical protein
MTMSDLQAWDVLRDHQKQCDADGCEVQVSRQAVDETLTALHTAFDRIAELEAENERLQALYEASMDDNIKLRKAITTLVGYDE